MRIRLIRISSCDLPHHPAYVAMNLEQVGRVCELLETKNTVWSREEIVKLGSRASNGEFDMVDNGPFIYITLPNDMKTIPFVKALKVLDGSLALLIDGEHVLPRSDFYADSEVDMLELSYCVEGTTSTLVQLFFHAGDNAQVSVDKDAFIFKTKEGLVARVSCLGSMNLEETIPGLT